MAVYGYTRGGTGAALPFQTWAKNIEVPAYEKMTFIPTLDDAGRPYGVHNIRYWDTLTTQALAATNTSQIYLTGLTGNAGTPTNLTITPAGIYCVVGANDDVQSVTEIDLEPGMRTNVEQALAEACDSTIAAQISNLTDGFGDAATVGSAADIRKLIFKLRISSPAVMVGERTIYACLHPGAGEGLTSAQEFMNAEIRGDAENPWVRGMFVKAFGTLFKFTTKVPTANGNGGEGAVYVPECFAVGWNQRPRVEAQRNGLANFVLGYAHLGGRVKWDSRGKYYRTVVTI